jgi:hypothetical protein
MKTKKIDPALVPYFSALKRFFDGKGFVTPAKGKVKIHSVGFYYVEGRQTKPWHYFKL